MDTKRRRGSGTCCFYYPPRKWQKQGQKGSLSFLFKNFLSYIFPALCRSYVEKNEPRRPKSCKISIIRDSKLNRVGRGF